MNKCKPPQLAPCSRWMHNGSLAAQNDYMPLEIMTDCAKRSYFTHSFSSLWGYHPMCVYAASEACGPPSASPVARGRNAKRMPSLTHDKLGDRWPKQSRPFLAFQPSLDTPAKSQHVTFTSHQSGKNNRSPLSLVSTGMMKHHSIRVRRFDDIMATLLFFPRRGLHIVLIPTSTVSCSQRLSNTVLSANANFTA